MYKISKQSSKNGREPYIGVLETEDNYFMISELSDDLADAKIRLPLKFKREGKYGVIYIYKAKSKSLSKILDLHSEQFNDSYIPTLKEMEKDINKFLRKYCENVGVAYLAPPPPPVLQKAAAIKETLTDRFIENIEFLRS